MFSESVPETWNCYTVCRHVTEHAASVDIARGPSQYKDVVLSV